MFSCDNLFNMYCKPLNLGLHGPLENSRVFMRSYAQPVGAWVQTLPSLLYASIYLFIFKWPEPLYSSWNTKHIYTPGVSHLHESAPVTVM